VGDLLPVPGQIAARRSTVNFQYAAARKAMQVSAMQSQFSLQQNGLDSVGCLRQLCPAECLAGPVRQFWNDYRLRWRPKNPVLASTSRLV